MSTPDALRLADAIDPFKRKTLDNLTWACAADELRRQHAEIERLTGINSALCRKTNALTIQSARDAEEIERLRADAARYRWLRLKVYVCPKERILRIADTYLKIGAVPEMLDSAIDAAMRDAPNVGIEAPTKAGAER